MPGINEQIKNAALQLNRYGKKSNISAPQAASLYNQALRRLKAEHTTENELAWRTSALVLGAQRSYKKDWPGAAAAFSINPLAHPDDQSASTPFPPSTAENCLLAAMMTMSEAVVWRIQNRFVPAHRWARVAEAHFATVTDRPISQWRGVALLIIAEYEALDEDNSGSSLQLAQQLLDPAFQPEICIRAANLAGERDGMVNRGWGRRKRPAEFQPDEWLYRF